MRKYTEQELEQVRSDYMENVNWMAQDEAGKAESNLSRAFDEYINAISDFEFRNGFLYAQMLRESEGESIR